MLVFMLNRSSNRDENSANMVYGFTHNLEKFKYEITNNISANSRAKSVKRDTCPNAPIWRENRPELNVFEYTC